MEHAMPVLTISQYNWTHKRLDIAAKDIDIFYFLLFMFIISTRHDNIPPIIYETNSAIEHTVYSHGWSYTIYSTTVNLIQSIKLNTNKLDYCKMMASVVQPIHTAKLLLCQYVFLLKSDYPNNEQVLFHIPSNHWAQSASVYAFTSAGF